MFINYLKILYFYFFLGYAKVTLPVESDGLEAGTYQFHMDVSDCENQRDYARSLYYFAVE